MNEKRLVRYRDDKMVFGVASGIAGYLNIDPILVRLAFVLTTLAGGPGILAYLIMAIIMPEESGVVAKAYGFDEEEIIIEDAA